MSPAMADPSPEVDDVDVRATVIHLARPRAGGGYVIERAAILAAGSDSALIEGWILDHAGRPEQSDSTARGGGLHGGRLVDSDSSRGLPRRYVLPPGALDATHDPPNSPHARNS